MVPTPLRRKEGSFRCCEGGDMLPDLGVMGCEAGAAMRKIRSNGDVRMVGRWCATPAEERQQLPVVQRFGSQIKIDAKIHNRNHPHPSVTMSSEEDEVGEAMFVGGR
ncbi:unnamed protein product [Lactuca virosa]|uniref:Uncharacterized protein n=1 Tax=Lactuca virosa TaxID=75947 RepID=A0AAU9MEF6_9ASTR|nr:unnamed protein product [Lactuca virosa]